jgi:hypothetical protein
MRRANLKVDNIWKTVLNHKNLREKRPEATSGSEGTMEIVERQGCES